MEQYIRAMQRTILIAFGFTFIFLMIAVFILEIDPLVIDIFLVAATTATFITIVFQTLTQFYNFAMRTRELYRPLAIKLYCTLIEPSKRIGKAKVIISRIKKQGLSKELLDRLIRELHDLFKEMDVIPPEELERAYILVDINRKLINDTVDLLLKLHDIVENLLNKNVNQYDFFSTNKNRINELYYILNKLDSNLRYIIRRLELYYQINGSECILFKIVE